MDLVAAIAAVCGHTVDSMQWEGLQYRCIESSAQVAMTHSGTEQEFLTLADADRLVDQMASKFAFQESRSIAIGLHAGARSATVMLESPGPVLTPDASLVLPTGCLAQVFTATLIMLAVRDGRISLGDDVHVILPAAKRHCGAGFNQVKVRHLLNHTHGLDDSSLEHIPRQAGARIDADRLCACLGSVVPLFEPGKMYGYGRAGPYLAAAILEELFDEPFERVLVRQLFDPLAIPLRKEPAEGEAICPAMGGCLQVSTRDLLKFLTWHLPQARSDPEHRGSLGPMAAMYQDIVAIPGWNLERGSGLGWRWYGDDWFGHAGHSSVGSLIVRVNVKHQIAFAVTAKGCNALQMTTQMFGRALPDFAIFKFPLRLANEDMAGLDFRKYVGCYQNSATSVQVTHDDPCRLRTVMHIRNGNPSSCEPVWRATLYPFASGLFMTVPRPSGANLFSYFSHSGAGGYTYLQIGPHLLRRGES